MAKALKREDKIIWAIPIPMHNLWIYVTREATLVSIVSDREREDVETWTMEAGAAKDQLYAFLFFRKNDTKRKRWIFCLKFNLVIQLSE